MNRHFCDICGVGIETSKGSVLVGDNYYGLPSLMGRNSKKPYWGDICSSCITKIEKFVYKLEEEKNGTG